MRRSEYIPASVETVDVYRNLHTGTWSAKAVRAPLPLRGRIVAHPTRVVLGDCAFRVNAKGRDKVRATCSKNVHSVVRGVPMDRRPSWSDSLVVDVGYNPYLFDSFVVLANGHPIRRAAWVAFPETTVGGRPQPLTVGLYPEDAHLMHAPKSPMDPRRAARMAWCRQSPAERARTRDSAPPIANPRRKKTR